MNRISEFDNKVILVTGGTGSFGRKFIEMVSIRSKPKKIIVYSRDELKQWEMAQTMNGINNIRFFIGDVRDKSRLNRAFNGVDYVVHAAASKIIHIAEYNPFECVKTNIIGAMNVIDAAIDQGVKKVVALSTDKASSPINLYGGTKLVSDKLFVAGNSYSGKNTKFSIVRYGNVMNSRGSIIPFFKNLKLQNISTFPITDTRMTRFMISIEQGVDLVLSAFNDMKGGEIYIKKIPSIKILDILEAVAPGSNYEVVGLRPGEKIHEQMISMEEAQFTFEYEDYYKILPAINNWCKNEEMIKDGKLVKPTFIYNSNNNNKWLSSEDLIKILSN